MNDLLEQLRSSAPPPDAGYTQQLEDRLVAELTQMQDAARKEPEMLLQPSLPQTRRQNLRRALASPLMLAAALLIVIAAAWLFGPTLWRGNTHVALGPTRQALVGYSTITPDNAGQLTLVDTLGNGAVYQAAYSPDGTTLALAGSLGVWLYDADALNGDSRLLMTDVPATAVTFSPDGTVIASGHQNGDIHLWNASNGQPVDVSSSQAVLMDSAHDDRVNTLAFSPDGTLLASGSGSGGESGHNIMQLWDVARDAQLWVERESLHPVWSVAFRADGQAVAFDSGSSTQILTDYNNAASFYTVERTPTQAAAPHSVFLPDGTLVINEGPSLHFYQVERRNDAPLFVDDGRVQVGETTTNTAMLGHIGNIAASADGTQIVAGTTSGGVYVVDVETREVTTLREPDNAQVLSVAVSRSGQVAATFNDGQVRTFDLATGEAGEQLDSFDYAITNLMPFGDNQLATTAIGSTLRRWDVTSRAPLNTFRLDGHTVYDSDISADGTAYAYLTLDDGLLSYLYVRSLRDNTEVRIGNSTILDPTFSHDGQLVAGVAQQHSLIVADAATGTIKRTWDENRDDYWFSPVFSPNDTHLAVGRSGGITIFSLESEAPVLNFTVGAEDTVVSSLRYSADGRTLLAKVQPALERNIRNSYTVLEPQQENIQLLLLDAETGERIHDLTLPSPENNPDLYRTSEAHFSPDGALVAVLTSVQYGSMRVDLWNTTTGERLDVPALDEIDPLAVAFSTDGDLLMTGGWDGLVRLYAVAP